MNGVLTILLAGGAGKRLAPLTCDQAKPAMPFGGSYRLIDITLSNCVNSGLARIYILTQHRALTLNRHIQRAWRFLPAELGAFVEVLSPMKRIRDTWYLGTADAVYQNLASIAEEAPPYTLILSADHVYKMNYRRMLEAHLTQRADVTLATTLVSPREANQFGVVTLDQKNRIIAFAEKPGCDAAARSPFDPNRCEASLGIYLFSTPVLLAALLEDAEDPASSHDFGRDLLPRLIRSARLCAHQFIDENRKTLRYWRDVGTLDAYYEANMDLVAVDPEFNLYDDQWPLLTATPALPPAKFVFGDLARMGIAIDSLVSHGCIISGSRVVRSVLSPRVRVSSYSQVEDCVIFENVSIGRHCRIRRAIIEDHLDIPAGFEVGVSPAADRQAGHWVTDSGIVVLHAGSPGILRKQPIAYSAIAKGPEVIEPRRHERRSFTHAVANSF